MTTSTRCCQSGYTILFGSNPQEAADLAAISYKISAMSLMPVANAMDGFATSHLMSEAQLPEPELLKEFLGDPAGRIQAPTVAQEILFGAKGRVFQLKRWLARNKDRIAADTIASIGAWLDSNADAVEADNAGRLADLLLAGIPDMLGAQWRRQWVNAWEKGTRQRVPALVDMIIPGLTGGVQNQPDFQAGAADHRTHFLADVPRFVGEAMAEFGELTGRKYAPVMTYRCDDAETVWWASARSQTTWKPSSIICAAGAARLVRSPSSCCSRSLRLKSSPRLPASVPSPCWSART